MAPTEVLAEQHHMSLSAMLAGLVRADSAVAVGRRGVRMELLTNRTTGADRARLWPASQTASVDLVVGTHALLTEAVRFSRASGWS